MDFKVHDIRGASHPLDQFARPLHDLRISVMDRCNFRCPYCMPKEQFHEHYRFLKSLIACWNWCKGPATWRRCP
jgi:sulfatase maturation enzyme AslB (radical SAM superfamily)